MAGRSRQFTPSSLHISSLRSATRHPSGQHHPARHTAPPLVLHSYSGVLGACGIFLIAHSARANYCDFDTSRATLQPPPRLRSPPPTSPSRSHANLTAELGRACAQSFFKMNPAELTLTISPNLTKAIPNGVASKSLGPVSRSAQVERVNLEPIYTQLKSALGEHWGEYQAALKQFALGKRTRELGIYCAGREANI